MRVALYSRVSTQEQAANGLSIDAQKAALEEWAANYTVVDHYCDPGVSARSPASKRPDLQRMLRDCEDGKIDLIVFTKLDRFFRNIKEYYKVEEILESCGVSWRAIHEDYETETAAGRLKVNIMLAVAQDEADRTSERIKAVFDRKRAQGLVATGHVAFGLELLDGRLAPSADADTVREMFAEYIATRSSALLARKYGRSLGGIHYILQNKNYLDAGVISPDTWQTVQNIRASREPRETKPNRVYLFSGLLICPHCGGRLSVVVTKGVVYYRCRRSKEGRCEGIHVREDRVEEWMLAHLMPAVDDVLLEVSEKEKRPVDLAALKKKRDRLTDLYVNDLIAREKYERDFLEVSRAISDAERVPRPVDRSEVMSVLEVYKTLSRAAQKAFWSNLVKSITPASDGFDFVLNCT